MPVNKPSEVVDPAAAIAAAEKEATCIDILVCGNCQGVFHFVEEFTEHKTKNDCEKTDKATINVQQSNKKPQVWAFLIWKNSQQHKSLDQQGSWKLYQKWCNMPDSEKQSWITAGRNIQTFISLSHTRDATNSELPAEKLIVETEDEVEEDFVVEKIVGKRYNHKKRQVEYLLKWEGYPPEQNTWEPLSNLTTCKSLLQEYERTAGQNDKGSNSKLSGVLKRDLTPANVKLQNSNLSKPPGVIPNRHVYGDRSKDPLTPTLQTQRKIVPVTPLSNSITPNKVSIPILAPVRAEVKENVKPVNNVDLSNDVSKLNKSPSNLTPLKKRLISNSEDTSTPIVASPEKRIIPSKEKPEPSKEWCITIDDDDDDVVPVLKRPAPPMSEISSDDAKRQKLNDSNEIPVQRLEDAIELSKSGIFKKSDLKEKCPSISHIYGKNTEVVEPKSKENLRGVLRVDHSQYPDIVAGIYKMTLAANGTSAKIDLLNGEKQVSAILLTMPGPKGGVILLSNRFDTSKIVPPKPVNPVNTTTKVESPAFRGIFPKNKVIEDSPSRLLKPDFSAKTTNAVDNSKNKPKSALRNVLGSGTMPRVKGKTSINSPTGISRFKPSFGKSYGDAVQDSSSTRASEGDNLMLEFGDCDNSDMEEYTLPDDFPQELDMEPLSPTRPLTLDPETGKRLMRAEGEPTPQPTPEPSPEPSPVPSPVPSQVLLKEEKDSLSVTDNLILKADDTADGETYAEINGNTYKVTNAAQVGLLQNATFTQDGELKGIPVTGALTDEEAADGSNMLTITGDDGLVYQVANAKLEGDTIVVASGEDEQHCVFVTEDGHQVMQRTNEDGSTVLTLESAYADGVAQLVPNQVNILPDGSHIYVKQEDNGQVELVQIQGSDITESEAAEQEDVQMTEGGEDTSGQVVAQLIEAGEPAPGGGPRRVVLLLPDGNIMVTEVDEEQFAALELEKQ